MTKPTRRLTLSRTVKVLTLSIVMWLSAAGHALAANALIISAPGYAYPATITNLTTLLTAASYTVTSVTAVPADLSSYQQVWDVRIDTGFAAGDSTIFATYLSGGGSLFLMGENAFFSARNNSVIGLVSSLGGGSLGSVTTSFASQQIRPPFTGPNAVGSVAWQASGRLSASGNGSFISTEAGGGSAVVLDRGTLANAPAGTLITVFDINFLLGPVTPNETDIAKNIIAYLAAPTAVTLVANRPGVPPTITSVADQVVAIGGTATVSFGVSGGVIADGLTVRARASDTTFVPRLTLTRLDHDGHWTLTMQAGDGRTGSAVITLTVSDSFQETSTSFTIATATATTPPPISGTASNLVASPSGSGVALTWLGPSAGAPARYAISLSTTPGGANVSVFVTADAATSYVIPAVLPGTYYFRVYPIGDVLGSPSNEASVTAAGSPGGAGVPIGLVSSVNGSTVTIRWNAPAGQSLSAYLIEAGTTAGGSEIVVFPTATTTLTRDVGAGLYYVRVKSLTGGTQSAPSNETSISVGAGACVAAPVAPVLLPVVATGGLTTFSWLLPPTRVPDAATAADSYRIDLTSSSGAVMSATVGAGTSASYAIGAGDYRVRVTGLNRCGTSAASNEVSFTQP